MSDSHIVRRCTLCGLSFPNDSKWEECAQCGEETAPIQTVSPANITDEEATSLLRHREFDEHLEKEGRK